MDAATRARGAGACTAFVAVRFLGAPEGFASVEASPLKDSPGVPAAVTSTDAVAFCSRLAGIFSVSATPGVGRASDSTGLLGFLAVVFLAAAPLVLAVVDLEEVDFAVVDLAVVDFAVVDFAGAFRAGVFAAGFFAAVLVTAGALTGESPVDDVSGTPSAAVAAVAPLEEAAGFVVVRGALALAVEDELRAADFFGAGEVVSPPEAPSEDVPGTDSVAPGAVVVDRAAGFFFGDVGVDDRGFAGVRGFDAGPADWLPPSVPDPSSWGLTGAAADSFDDPESGALSAGSSGVSSGEAGGTIVTDTTYQLPASDSRRMSFCAGAEPVNTPCALLRYDNNKRQDTDPNKGAALTLTLA
ncbi:hypothetical protein L1277_000516 [Okibacterium sp. HSC-33S16]|uniref:hypothetical protein n=1 Tax=Okibacterium sp. HSC-33S16 TaxID=2910965 RepID=UPI0020A0D712|nr:hypothetical protein [Okibacterium sp. HSC-33S16]MCP2030452.1 hypothetical protein [Okibacterium sp. HSC-33S16]